MFKPVYVCRASFEHIVHVIPASIGIVKIKGCHMFCPAKKYDGKYQYSFSNDEEIPTIECHERYSSVPAKGEAWLVEEGKKYINWTRVDHNMHLLDGQGNIVKEPE